MPSSFSAVRCFWLLPFLLIDDKAISVQCGLLKRQRLCVYGKVECSKDTNSDRPHVVKLWDEDDGPNPDDLMASGMTLDDGSFSLCGEAGDLYGVINPVLKVYTQCDNAADEDLRCFRKLPFEVSKSYVGGNYTFPETIDVANRIPGETRRCYTGDRFNDWLKKYTGYTAKEWMAKISGKDVTGFMNIVTTGVSMFKGLKGGGGGESGGGDASAPALPPNDMTPPELDMNALAQ